LMAKNMRMAGEYWHERSIACGVAGNSCLLGIVIDQ
jgi:hypothetical protein